jgi:hypothetical protein
MKDGIGEGPLVIKGETDDMGISDSPVCGFLRGSHDKVTDAAALQFSRALDDLQRLRSNPCFEAGGSLGFMRHGHNSPAMYVNLPYMSTAFM